MQTCRTCGIEKPLEDFNRDRTRPAGRNYHCKECLSETRRRASPEQKEAHRRQVRDQSRRQYAEDPAYRSAKLARNRERDQAVKDAVLDHYGRACACCGSTDRLSIDHVNGDGEAHLQALGTRNRLAVYRWLIANGFPPGFQVLCRPCNTSKGQGSRCALRHGEPVVLLSTPAKTHCWRRHEFTPENTYVQPSTGQRQCRQCMRINAREYQRKLAARRREAA